MQCKVYGGWNLFKLHKKKRRRFSVVALKKIVFDKLLAWHPSMASVAQGSGHESRHSTAP